MCAIEIRRFELVVFDLDGVLVDTSPCHYRAYADLWAKLGVAGPDYGDIAGRKTNEVVAEYTVGLDPTTEQLREWTAFKQKRARCCIAGGDIAFSDALPALQALRAAGVLLALGTGASRPTVEALLARLGMAESFALVATAEDVERGKPAPDVYVDLLQRLGAAADRTLVVEDSPAGLAAGLGAGAFAASVRAGQHAEHRNFIGYYDDLRSLFAMLDF